MSEAPPLRILAVAGVVELLLLGVADGIWLTVTGDVFYRRLLGPLLAPAPVIWAAVAFYLLYAAGVTAFVLRPALASARHGSLLPGAGFGLVAYGTYDLTSQATLYQWPPMVTLVDMLWGMLLTGGTAWLTVRLMRLRRR